MNKNFMNDLEHYIYSNPKFNSRIPMYNDSSDYTTNAPSYYDDLARKNKLMKTLALRIWEYEEEMIRRLEQWDKNLEDFPEDVKDLLEKWLEDGTLDHIINDTIFSWKADKTYVDSELGKKVDKITVGVNPIDFGAKGDGVSNDTEFFEQANVLSQTIRLPRDKTFRLENFVPKEGTVIISEGSTIARHSDSFYDCTTSSAAIVIANNDIKIIGGRYIDLSDSTQTFSGSILIDGGSVTIDNCLIENSWGGVFGNSFGESNKISDYVRINNCEIRNCFHNTYLGNIENFLFTNNNSHHSNRDGLRTLTHVMNSVITNNHIHNNGDGAATQSQDGLDLYVGGRRMIISNNMIYNNVSNGLDIKRNEIGNNQTNQNEEFIITDNFIYNNLEGIKISTNESDWGYIKNITVSNNHIFNCSSYGMRLNHIDIYNITNNQIYDNGYTGLRIENSVIGGNLTNNIIYNNDSTGLQVVGTAKKANVTGNKIYNVTGGNQNTGLVYSSDGLCRDNDVFGHFNNNYVGVPDKAANGHINYANYRADDNSVIALVASNNGIINNITFTSGVPGTYDIEISKRKLDGTFENVLFNGQVTNTTSYIKHDLDINLDAIYMKKDQVIFINMKDTAVNAIYGFNMIN